MSGGRALVCSVQRSPARACLWRSAVSLVSRFYLQVAWGLNFPGRMGMRSLTGLPKTHMAGDSFVVGSGVFLYCRTARWNASELRSPLAVTLPEQPFDCLHSHLCPAVAVWECDRAEAVMYAPVVEELRRGGREFRAAIRC